MLLFLPVHEGFGGRIRYLISGGSALPLDVMKAFYGLGFDFFEGYGLTETSPVLSVTSPKDKPIAGSVGHPLPGIEVKLREPDPDRRRRGDRARPQRDGRLLGGRGATAEAIRDGWFHTGDLGRFDEKGNLYLVGRSKDVIVDANGKNVYPDEIEDLYRDSPFIKELSVVGVADGIGEQVACAVVPDVEHDPALSRGRGAGADRGALPQGLRRPADRKRVRGLHFWEGDLPKTGKRSVKRREVAAEIAAAPAQERGDHGGPAAVGAIAARSPGCWRPSRRCRGAAGRRAAGEPVRRARLRQPDVRRAVERARDRGA